MKVCTTNQWCNVDMIRAKMVAIHHLIFQYTLHWWVPFFTLFFGVNQNIMIFIIPDHRLREHIALNKRETLRQLLNRVAPCRALFNIFDTNRHLFCHHIIDPLNGLWFSAFACLLLWAILTPIALGLANVYKQMNSSRGFRRSNSHQ